MKKTPACPGCKAKFSHDQMTARCRVCGLPDEVAYKGLKAVVRWQKAMGYPVARGGASSRRRRAHGRAQHVPRRTG